MNVPGIAKKSFEEFQDHPEHVGIVKKVLKSLKKFTQSLRRVRFIHRNIDEYNKEVFSHPLVKDLSPCKKGCSACCHTQVSVTEDEAELLAHRVRSGLKIDEASMNFLSQAGNDSQKFYDIPFEQRKCLFLGQDGDCRIYEDRPAVCRTNAVLGDPAQCDTRDSIQSTRLVKTPKSDMVIYAAFMFSKSSGTLPYMLARALEKDSFYSHGCRSL